MSTAYNGRRAPNVSQYLHNLNTVPSAHELASNDIHIGEGDLDFLTSAEFFDFDSFHPNNVDLHARGEHVRDVEHKGHRMAVNGSSPVLGIKYHLELAY